MNNFLLESPVTYMMMLVVSMAPFLYRKQLKELTIVSILLVIAFGIFVLAFVFQLTNQGTESNPDFKVVEDDDEEYHDDEDDEEHSDDMPDPDNDAIKNLAKTLKVEVTDRDCADGSWIEVISNNVGWKHLKATMIKSGLSDGVRNRKLGVVKLVRHVIQCPEWSPKKARTA